MDLGERKFEITTECIAYKDNILYSVGREMNILFSIDLRSNSVETMLDMPPEDNFVERLYNGICLENDNLILVPFNAKKLWIYNLRDKIWSAVDISSLIDPNMKGKFVGGVLKHGIAYLIGYKYHGILAVNISTKEVRELLTGEEYGRHVFWGQNAAVYNEKLYLASSLANVIICIDLDKSDYEVLKLDDSFVTAGNCNDAIICDGKTFFIKRLRGNTFYEWTPPEKPRAIQIDPFYNSSESFFNGIAAMDHYILFYSPKGKSYLYNRKEPQHSKIVNQQIYFAKSIPHIGTVICQKGKIIICDSLLQEKAAYEISINERTHTKYIHNSKLTAEPIQENEYVNVKDFIDLVSIM